MGRGGIATFAVSAFAALAFAAPAAALVKHSAEGEKVDGLFRAVAECGNGERVISGGYATAVGADEPSVTESRAKGKRAWIVRMNEEFTGFAYCSKQLKASRASATKPIVADTSGTAVKARCPRGSRAVSGGWRFSDPVDNSPIFRSQPKGRKWSVRGFDEGLPDLTSFAYCLKNPELEVRRTSASIGSTDTATAQVSCRQGEEFLGGGWSVTPRPDWDNAAGPDPFFADVVRSPSRTWIATAINFGTPGDIQAIAVCAE